MYVGLSVKNGIDGIYGIGIDGIFGGIYGIDVGFIWYICCICDGIFNVFGTFVVSVIIHLMGYSMYLVQKMGLMGYSMYLMGYSIFDGIFGGIYGIDVGFIWWDIWY